MGYIREHCYKIIITVAIIIVCLISSSAAVNVCVAQNGGNGGGNDNEEVTLEASLRNDIIIVKVQGAKGNPMHDTQIWGDYGRGWFLIKDYNEKQNANDLFEWDLTYLHRDNESYLRGIDNNYNFDDSDMVRIYARYTKSNADKVELYKTFYLGEPKQDVQLITNQEIEGYEPVCYDFPVVVKQNGEVELELKVPSDNGEKYFVKIIGDGYTNDLSGIEGTNKFTWEPEHSGTFYIAVYDSNGNLVLQRKAYVNSDNGQYLQLGNLDIGEDTNEVVYIRLTVKTSRPTDYQSRDVRELLKFTISEPQVWSRTIKDYGDKNVTIIDKTTYEVSEDNNSFKLGSGIYAVTSYIKAERSFEYDDVIRKYYRKSGESDLNFNVIKSCKSKNNKDIEPDGDGKYWIVPNSKDQLKFTFSVDDPDTSGKYEYAFFLEDARGKRMVQRYSQYNTEFEWNPAEPGKYTVYARIRKINGEYRNINPLPNSYEKEIAFPIHIEQENLDVYLREVKIGTDKWILENGDVKTPSNPTLNAHTLNIIEIDAEKNQGNEPKHNANRLMYKVYAVNKGYMYSLGDYSFSNIIPFYPKSTGQYRLIIMVKDVESGAEEDRWEIFVNSVEAN